MTGDFARRLCDRPALCPAEWRTMFNPGTTPSLIASDYPAMSELGAGMLAVYRDLCDVALHGISVSSWRGGRPLVFGFARPDFGVPWADDIVWPS